MNVNAAVLTDVMMTQSTAPPKDSGKTATEASGQNFQQVMEQYTECQERKPASRNKEDSCDGFRSGISQGKCRQNGSPEKKSE